MKNTIKNKQSSNLEHPNNVIVFTMVHIYVELSFSIIATNFQPWSMQSDTDKLLVRIVSIFQPWSMQSGIDTLIVSTTSILLSDVN